MNYIFVIFTASLLLTQARTYKELQQFDLGKFFKELQQIKVKNFDFDVQLPAALYKELNKLLKKSRRWGREKKVRVEQGTGVYKTDIVHHTKSFKDILAFKLKQLAELQAKKKNH